MNLTGTPLSRSARYMANDCMIGTRASPVSLMISVGVVIFDAYVIGDWSTYFFRFSALPNGEPHVARLPSPPSPRVYSSTRSLTAAPETAALKIG